MEVAKDGRGRSDWVVWGVSALGTSGVLRFYGVAEFLDMYDNHPSTPHCARLVIHTYSTYIHTYTHTTMQLPVL